MAKKFKVFIPSFYHFQLMKKQERREFAMKAGKRKDLLLIFVVVFVLVGSVVIYRSTPNDIREQTFRIMFGNQLVDNIKMLSSAIEEYLLLLITHWPAATPTQNLITGGITLLLVILTLAVWIRISVKSTNNSNNHPYP